MARMRYTEASAAADLIALSAAGAEAIFPPGTVIAEAAEDLLRSLSKKLGHDRAAAE